MTFDQWFNEHCKFAINFQPIELTHFANNTHDGISNSMPPKSIWPNIIPTLYVLQQYRSRCGKPITITSAYRDKDYNAAVKGSKQSQHRQFRALDFVVKGVDPTDVYNELSHARLHDHWTGGLGHYPRTSERSGFTHIDTRPVSVSWDG